MYNYVCFLIQKQSRRMKTNGKQNISHLIFYLEMVPSPHSGTTIEAVTLYYMYIVHACWREMHYPF